jgi:hypothetical protein
MPPNPPRPLPTVRSRRNEPRTYAIERLGLRGNMLRRAEQAPAVVVDLANAGRTGSALHRRLRAAEIDAGLGRLRHEAFWQELTHV